ncbi:dynein intermediate chain 3, ciliary-like [Centruroides vittatus]|uniref:dynein intermediate chain 3, ciliary-like n=1 Tax=Centruroides vittatus TaxID=120091 RepID=UPI00351098BC
MNINYIYTKKRRQFGRPCNFTDHGPDILVDIKPDVSLRDNFVQASRINREVQCSTVVACNQVNTEHYGTESRGMNHEEGGWPKDVDPTDEKQVTRFRKKVEKDEHFQNVVLNLAGQLEHCVKQNNAINIYEEYFVGDEEEEKDIINDETRVVNVIRDNTTPSRYVTCISWSPEEENKLVTTLSTLKFEESSKLPKESYIWDINNLTQPVTNLCFSSSLICAEFNPKDFSYLLAGAFNGQIAFWDLRKNDSEPFQVTPPEYSHHDPVYKALWLHSRSGKECFSASTDGQVLWWDIRKLNEPTEVLILDPRKGIKPCRKSAYRARCLEYDPTIPTKFMIGTEEGMIFIGNRKGKSLSDKVGTMYKQEYGSVRALQRNYFISKVFLSAHNRSVKIWAEECRDSPILTFKNDEYSINDACWNPFCPSVFFAAKDNGIIETWNILTSHSEPFSKIKVTEEGLQTLRLNEKNKLLAAGSKKGKIVLVALAEDLKKPHKTDKTFLSNMFEREIHRIKILEARQRELKVKAKADVHEEKELKLEMAPSEVIDEYDKIINKEYENLYEDYQKQSKEEGFKINKFASEDTKAQADESKSSIT